MLKSENLPMTPHLEGLINESKKMSLLLNRNGVDIEVFFHVFISNLTLGCSSILEKSQIDIKKLADLSNSFCKKQNFKHPSDHLTTKVKKIFLFADLISKKQMEADHLCPEIVFLAFFTKEYLPKAIKKYFDFKNNEDLLSNEIIIDLFSKTLEYCKDFNLFEEEQENNDDDQEEDCIEMFKDNPILSQFAENLNLKAAQGKFDKIVDFDNKIEELATILCRKKKPNAILVGPAGTGKTSLVEGLALKIINGDAPELLSNKVIYCINLAGMVAGTEYRGQFEKRLQDFVEEAKKYSNLILFIDEIHTLVGAGGSGNHGLEASNILKPELARGTISCIGATTITEYTNTIKKDTALDRRFERVIVREPSKFQMEEILPQVIDFYEDFHQVIYSKDFISNVISYCERFTPNKFYPDKAIDIIDHCGAQAKINFWEMDESIKEQQKKIVAFLEKNGFIDDEMVNDMNLKLEAWEKTLIKKTSIVEISYLEDFFEKKKNPMTNQDKNLNLIKNLKKTIIGQDKALNKLLKSINISNLKLGDSASFSKPDCFLIYGGNSVGKSLFCKLIKEESLKIGSNIIGYNGIEFSDNFAPFKIISDHSNNTSLAEKICIYPNSLIIIDDFDKVHESCFGLFSQILKDGKLQMKNGDIADFSNCKILITSNCKSSGKSMGFNLIKEDPSPSIPKEILDIITDKIYFGNLKKIDLRRILFNKLKKIKEKINAQNYKLIFDFEFIKKFVEKECGAENNVECLNKSIESIILPKIYSSIENNLKDIQLI